MRLSTRVVLLMLTIVSLSTLANTVLTRFQAESMHKESETILAQTIVHALREAIVQDVIDSNKLRVTNTLRSIAASNTAIEYLFVGGTDRTLFAHSFEGGFPRDLFREDMIDDDAVGAHISGKYQTENGLIYEYHDALIEGLDPTLYIGINQTKITERLAWITQGALITSLIVAMLAVLFGYFWSRKIATPLTDFTRLVKRLGSGKKVDFSEVKTDALEIRLLATAFQTATKDRELALTELREREQDLSATLNGIGDAVIVIDGNGVIQTFNKAAESMFDYATHEISGRQVEQLMPAHVAREHHSYIQRYLETGEGRIVGSSREVQSLRKNGETFPMRLSVSEMPDDKDGRKRFIASCQDLTHVKQQEEQLRRNQRMDALGKLTGGIAHDFNNLLSVILGYSHLLEKELAGDPEINDYVNEIARAGERGTRLIDKLMSFTRKTSSEAESLNINTVLLRERSMLERTLTARIKLDFDLGTDLWPILLNVGDLEDAIINMSINSMHAMDGSGELRIRTRNKQLTKFEADVLQLAPGNYVQLSISDTGCGMNETVKDRIFEPFFSTKDNEGMGLGLSQVYGTVERSGGSVSVYSEPDKGTRIDIYFPRHDEPITASSVQNEIPLSATLTGDEIILMVDDESALLNLNSKILSDQGYRVVCAEGAAEALSILKNEHVDLMLTDIVMPEVDGYQLAAIVQQEYPATKIQLMSGFSEERYSDIANDHLHKNLLRKPCSAQTLLKTIRASLDARCDRGPSTK